LNSTASAEAVLFKDRAEMLACLATDWLTGALVSNWWWRELLRGTTPTALLSREWIGAPECAAVSLEMLVTRSRALELLRRLPEEMVAALLEQILCVYGVPQVPRAELNSTDHFQSGRSTPSRKLDPGLSPVPAFEHSLELVPEAAAPDLTLTKRVLLAQALMLRRAPARARTMAFQMEVATWKSWIAAHSCSHLVEDSKTEPIPTSKSANCSVEPTAIMSGQITLKSQSVEHDASRQIAEATESVLGDLLRVETSRATATDISAYAEAKVVASTTGPATVQLIGHEFEPDPTQKTEPVPQKPLETVPPVNKVSGVETAFGGVLFLLNVALYLRLYSDFTSPHETNLELDIWDFISLLGLKFIGEDITADPLYEVLGSLAGRKKWQRPGTSYQPPDNWHLPLEWLEPFPEPFERKEIIRGGRLQVIHPAGFFVLDERREREAEAGGALDRWLTWMASYIEARLVLALGRNDGPQFLCRIPAHVSSTPVHVDVFYCLETHPAEIRLAGLDRDPGWIPAAGRYVAYHFD
jgi:hypothetical protein